MTFTVEDGTGITDANSYVDRTFALNYFADRGVDSWAAPSGQEYLEEQRLIKGTDYIETRWGGNFKGIKQFDVNQLSFPRCYIYDEWGNSLEDTVPVPIMVATCLYALRSIGVELMPDPTGGTYPIKREMKKVGPIEKEIAYDVTQQQLTQNYPAADRLLLPFLANIGGVYR